MFSNCGYKLFLDQGGVDARSLMEIQELSEREFASLAEETPGYGLMVWGKKVILLDTRMSKKNVLYERFSTNFHEKKEAVRTAIPEEGGLEGKIIKMASFVPISSLDVAHTLDIPVRDAEEILISLAASGYLVESSSGDKTLYSAKDT